MVEDGLTDDERMAKIAHASEQMSGILGEMSNALHSYFLSLRERGFTDEQAMSLTRDWSAAYWQVIFTRILNASK